MLEPSLGTIWISFAGSASRIARNYYTHARA